MQTVCHFSVTPATIRVVASNQDEKYDNAGILSCFVVSSSSFPDITAPLSAPAFSVCFPLLNAMLRESSGSTEETENEMTRALQIVLEHSQLRAATGMDDIVIDEVETDISTEYKMHRSCHNIAV